MPSKATRKRQRDKRKAISRTSNMKSTMPLPSRATWIDSLNYQTQHALAIFFEHARPMFELAKTSLTAKLHRLAGSASDKLVKVRAGE
jgi:hypothetical protein